MKAIMISIKPKWVAKILNGEKTIEIRKTCPEIFKHLKPYEGCSIDVYIYCTKEEDLFKSYIRMGYFTIRSTADDMKYNGKGKVVAKFTLNKVEEIKNNLAMRFFTKTSNEKDLLEKSCLNSDQLFWYLAPQELKVKCCGYAWHIDNLVIFDKPKELSEFRKHTHIKTFKDLSWLKNGEKLQVGTLKPLTRSPESWCYVEGEDYEIH